MAKLKWRAKKIFNVKIGKYKSVRMKRPLIKYWVEYKEKDTPYKGWISTQDMVATSKADAEGWKKTLLADKKVMKGSIKIHKLKRKGWF